eukprot:g7345.t1
METRIEGRIRREKGCTEAKIHSTSQLNIHCASHGLYAAIIDNKVALKIGTNDWSPGAGWKASCFGAEFCVWSRP